jgi:hypothetical protein
MFYDFTSKDNAVLEEETFVLVQSPVVVTRKIVINFVKCFCVYLIIKHLCIKKWFKLAIEQRLGFTYRIPGYHTKLGSHRNN